MAEETRNSLDGQAEVVVQAGRIGELHQHLHGGGVVTQPIPFQLPPALIRFENRRAEQERITGAVGDHAGVEDEEGREGPLVVALTGVGGVGKTALGFHVARRLAGRYPDGVLYVDLDDLRRDGVVEVADALGQLLCDMGVPPDWLDRQFFRREEQYWSRTQHKKLIVIVDNARYGSEALSLLPASAGSLVILTSHGTLADLDGAAAVEVPVGPLSVDHAVRLLDNIAADPRLAAEPEAVAELVHGCGGLPAALKVAGQWVRKYRRRSLSRLVAELTTELREKGIPMVEAVWDAAYAGLGEDAARLYRLLPQYPAPVVTAAAAAALLGEGPEDRTGDALEELESAGLLEHEHRPEGYRMHALLRGHAERCARKADPEQRESAAATRSLVSWYRRQAARADLLAAGPRMTLAQAPGAVGRGVDAAPDVEMTSEADAYAWLESQRHALYGCVRVAFETGLDEDAWALCEPLWTHFLDHAHYADVTDAFRTGVAAADRQEHLPAMIRMRCQLARPLWEQGRYDEAEQYLRQALAASQTLGGSEPERKLKASTVEFQGLLKSVRGDLSGAAADFEASRAIHEEIKNKYGVLLQTYLLGRTALRGDEVERAVTLLGEAHRMAREQDRERMTGRSGFEYGRALRRAGRVAEAEDLMRASLANARKRGSTTDEVRILNELAALTEEQGRSDEATRHREAARLLTEESGGLTGDAQSS